MKRLLRISFGLIVAQYALVYGALLLSKLGVDIGVWGSSFLSLIPSLCGLIGMLATPLLSYIYYRKYKKLEKEFVIYLLITLCIWALYLFFLMTYSGIGKNGLF